MEEVIGAGGKGCAKHKLRNARQSTKVGRKFMKTEVMVEPSTGFHDGERNTSFSRAVPMELS